MRERGTRGEVPMALPLYSLPESNSIRGTGTSFHFLGKQERRKYPQTVRKHFPCSPVPQFPNTFPKPHSSTGGPFQTFRKHSVPVACRHGQHPIRTSTAYPMRQIKRPPPTIPDENNVDPFGENKTVPDTPKRGGAYVSAQAHPVADLHFRKQAGPCSLMS